MENKLLCERCFQYKDFSEFYKRNTKKRKYSLYCKLCSREKYKIYNENNREKRKQQRRQYYQDNKENIKQYRLNNKENIKQYRLNNKEKLNEKSRINYQANKEKHKERNRIYHQKNPEKCIESKRKYYELYPNKRKAKSTIQNAITYNKLIKPNICEKCGKKSEIIHAHHWSYETKTLLDINWLCPLCHSKEHQMLKKLNIRLTTKDKLSSERINYNLTMFNILNRIILKQSTITN